MPGLGWQDCAHRRETALEGGVAVGPCAPSVSGSGYGATRECAADDWQFPYHGRRPGVTKLVGAGLTVTLLRRLMVLLAAQSGASLAAAPPSAQGLVQHVHASLSVADGKQVFRSGEPVRLVVSFTADATGYQVDTTIDKSARLEEQIDITPEQGVVRWQELQQMPDGYGRDYGSRSTLSDQPVEMKFPLNYWLRFDEPGDYAVRLRTRRVSYSTDGRTDTALPWIATNTVAFTIVMMSADEESAEASRVSTRLDMKPTCAIRRNRRARFGFS